jgi:uncharacterized protein (UPF0261 family)
MPIVIIGMLDEREPALRIIKDQIERRDHATILVDISIGTGGIVPMLEADVSPAEIARLGGGTIDEVTQLIDTGRERAISIMVNGLTAKISELYRMGEMEGVIAVAGMTGTSISLTTMSTLPFGLPKLLISSVVAMPAYANRLAQYLGLKDIVVMNSVVDMVGMNLPVHTVAINGANAIAGMVETTTHFPDESRNSIVITEFNFCDEGAHYVRKVLSEKYDVVSFHAQGIGDRAAVDFVRQKRCRGFIDLVPASYGEYLLGGNRASGPRRLNIANDLLIPYIISPCGFDMISCGPIDRKDKDDRLWKSRKLTERKLFFQDAMRVQARTTAEEMQQIARAVAERLNLYRDKKMVKFVIPTRGFSSLSVEGGALYDPDSDAAFVSTLEEHLDSGIKVFKVDTHINSHEFAATVAEALTEAFQAIPNVEAANG